MTKQALPDLNQLADTYDIVGELAGRDDAKMHLAKRRADGLDVLVVIANAPAGDEGNALSHLAADANLLTSLRHRSVLPVVDGRWVGPDTFALVLQRTSAPTLAELLSRRDEEFEYARIAAILGEVNGVLEWARAHKLVHRAVRPETLFVEPGTDHVHVAFSVAPLPASGMPGPEADGITIASLARAMLTRSPAAPERATQPLAELRPGLPVALIEETERLLHPSAAAEGPARDVTGYIARVAMAEALKSAEDHLEATRNAIEKQEQEHRAQIEKERREHEQQIATERQKHDEQIANERKQHDREMEAARKAHETLVADQAKQLQRERETHAKEVTEQQRKFEKQVADQQKLFEKQVADQQKQFEKQVADQQKAFERQVAEQQKQLQREREEQQRVVAQQTKQFAAERAQFERELVRQRQTLEKERAALAQERAALARDRAALLEERAGQERTTREERERLAAEAAALTAQAEVYTRTPQPPVVTGNGSDVEVAFPRHTEKSESPEPAPSAVSSPPTPPVTPPRPWVPRATPVAPVPAIPMGELVRRTREPEKSTPKREPQKAEVVRAKEQGPGLHERVVAPAAAWLAGLWSRRPEWRSSWNVPAAAVALVVLIGVTALALAGGGGHRASTVATATSPAASARIVDSASGNVYESVVPLPKVETDTGALSARATDWTPPPRKRVTPPAEPRPTATVRPDSVPAMQPMPGTEAGGLPAPGLPMPSTVDTTSRPPGAGLTAPTPRPAVRRDSAARDTVRSPVVPLPFQIPAPPPKRDSVPKQDTTAKRDSVGVRL